MNQVAAVLFEDTESVNISLRLVPNHQARFLEMIAKDCHHEWIDNACESLSLGEVLKTNLDDLTHHGLQILHFCKSGHHIFLFGLVS